MAEAFLCTFCINDCRLIPLATVSSRWTFTLVTALFQTCNLIAPTSSHLTCFRFVSLLCSESEGLDPELSWLGSLRFTGCLSGVRFNSICPLKAALLHPDSRVIVTSPLVQSSCAISSPDDPFAAGTTHSLSGKKKKTSPFTFFRSLSEHSTFLNVGFYLM